MTTAEQPTTEQPTTEQLSPLIQQKKKVDDLLTSWSKINTELTQIEGMFSQISTLETIKSEYPKLESVLCKLRGDALKTLSELFIAQNALYGMVLTDRDNTIATLLKQEAKKE